MISVIFPAYNEGKNVPELHSRIKKIMDEFGETYEIIAVDDGSSDDTLANLCQVKPVRVVVLSKNYGQTSAMDAGFKLVRGNIVVTLDADLQNDPKDIPRLINKLREGYDVVSGWRRDRHDNHGRRILSRSANWLTWKVTGLYLHDYACALKAYRKSVLEGIDLYGEMHVFLPAILYMRGAKIAEMEVTHHTRIYGLSKHNFLKAVKDISDLLTIKFIFSAARPLLFFGSVSVMLWLLATISVMTSVIMKIIDYRNFGQTPLPLLTVFLVITGLIFFALGFLAELLLRIYYESRGGRPYTIKEIIEK